MKITFSKQFYKTTFLCASLVLAGASVCSGSISFGWNAGTSSGSASSSSGSDPNVTAGSVSRVNGGTSAPEDTTSVSDYSGASGNYNFEAHAVAGTTVNTDTSTCFSLTLIPSAGYSITLNSLSFGSRSTATGPTSIAIYSSIDSFAASIGSEFVSANGIWSAPSGISLSGTGAADTAVELRIYGYGQSSVSGSAVNWRIDDISFTVTLNSVPEPAAWGAISGIGLLMLCSIRVWRQRHASCAF